MKGVIIWGATGQALVVEEILSFYNLPIVLFVDNNKSIQSPFENIPLVYGDLELDSWLREKNPSNYYFVVAIGGESGSDRYDIYQKLKSKGLKPYNVIHPTATISPSAVLGEGCQVMAGALVGVRVRMGDACIINTAASIDHESILGNGVHLAPGVTTAGLIEIGHFSFIGTQATLLPRIKIGTRTVIGAGSVVTKDIPDCVTCYGNPARIKV
jgi:sugar O-acyltransferase (sialic acid O-acetyltransferase NeuD family)